MAADRKEETDQPAGMPITGLILIDPALLPHIYFDIFVPLPLRNYSNAKIMSGVHLLLILFCIDILSICAFASPHANHGPDRNG